MDFCYGIVGRTLAGPILGILAVILECYSRDRDLIHGGVSS